MLLRVCKFQLAYLIIAYLKKRVKRICRIERGTELWKIRYDLPSVPPAQTRRAYFMYGSPMRKSFGKRETPPCRLARADTGMQYGGSWFLLYRLFPRGADGFPRRDARAINTASDAKSERAAGRRRGFVS